MHVLIKQTVVAAIVGVPLFIGTILHIIPALNTTTGYWLNWICALATLIVLVYSGGQFFRSAWRALLLKSSNMNTLIAMVAGVAWLYSVLTLIFINHIPLLEQHVYFDSAAIIIILVNIVSISEQYARRNTKAVIESLLELQPNTLAQIVPLVQQAQNSKPKLAHIADTVTKIFVPSVIVVSILTAFSWYYIGKEPVVVYMIVTFMSVLIIGCPFALGLAVPISVMVGIGKAAEYGILIRDANTIETLCKINTVILDKTGTITVGKPGVSEVTVMPGFDSSQVLSIAASLESGSEHPYALAILAAAKEKQLNIESAHDFQNFSGLGVKAIISKIPVCIGNRGFMEAQLVSVDPLREQAKNFAKTGATSIYVAHNKQLVGLITLVDPLKTEAKFLVQKLHDMQIRVIMITGDQQLTANSIAEQVGITEVIADVMPQEKANKISALQQEDAIIAMVGDGISDALALAQADVSFAINTGTDITIQTADIILINQSLDNIVEAIYISKHTHNNIKQNLFGAFIYSIIGIPIAAGVLFPLSGLLPNPILAAAAMALSSIAVISNANRLRLLQCP